MKPILSKLGAVDGRKPITVQFAAYADIDLVAFIVYSDSIGTVYKFGTVAPTGIGLARHFVINEGVVENRHDPYYLKIRCRITGSNNFTEYADTILFYAHEKPSIKFQDYGLANTVSGKPPVIKYPSYSFDCNYTYKTTEGEVVNRYEYYLYNADKELIRQSKCYYYRDYLKSFFVDGLDNHTTYYVRAKAESVGGYQLDTGYKAFETDYSEQVDGAKITVTNNYHTGSVSVAAEYPTTTSAGVTHVRIKRKRKASSTWMTIYEKELDFSKDLTLLPSWTSGFISESGTMVSSSGAKTSEYLEKANLSYIEFRSDTYFARLCAFNSDKKFLGSTDINGKGSSSVLGALKNPARFFYPSEWEPDYKDTIQYYRVSLIPIADKDTEFGNSDGYAILHAASSGYIVINHEDHYARGRECEYEYAVSPVMTKIELGYVKTSVKSDFDGAIITDGDKTYHICLEPKVESVEKVRSASIVETMGNKYPYLFFGNEANYYSGDFSGVAIRLDTTMDYFDINGGNDFRDELSAWLTNGEAKVLKMFDGREWLIGVNGNVKISCSEHYDKGTLEFSFVEIGDYESETDMYDNGLSEYAPAGGTA